MKLSQKGNHQTGLSKKDAGTSPEVDMCPNKTPPNMRIADDYHHDSDRPPPSVAALGFSAPPSTAARSRGRTARWPDRRRPEAPSGDQRRASGWLEGAAGWFREKWSEIQSCRTDDEKKGYMFMMIHDDSLSDCGHVWTKWWFTKIGLPPVIIHVHRIFYCKSSIFFGYPHDELESHSHHGCGAPPAGQAHVDRLQVGPEGPSSEMAKPGVRRVGTMFCWIKSSQDYLL